MRTNRASKRASTFSTYQHLNRKDPVHLAHAILDEKDLSPYVFLLLKDIEAEYQKLFGDCPDYRSVPPTPQKDKSILIYPITMRETKRNLRPLKQSTAGLDGTTREHLRNCELLDLCCLLNIVFGLCNSPDILRHNRTVLIQKKGTYLWWPIGSL